MVEALRPRDDRGHGGANRPLTQAAFPHHHRQNVTVEHAEDRNVGDRYAHPGFEPDGIFERLPMRGARAPQQSAVDVKENENAGAQALIIAVEWAPHGRVPLPARLPARLPVQVPVQVHR